MSAVPRARQLGVVGCRTCGVVCEDVSDERPVCPRCGSSLRRRKSSSYSYSWAFLLAGAIFYIPANILPVMYTNMLGSGGDSTIMSGVVAFWQEGAWDIAAIIFTASVAVPCTKFLVMALVLVTARRRSRWARRERARLYRLVEFIGYWSMLDVLVVAMVAALVQFHGLSTIEPRAGILYFGLSVILTMLSALSFEPRLIWDDKDDDGSLS